MAPRPKPMRSMMREMGKHYLPDRHATGGMTRFKDEGGVGKVGKTVLSKRPPRKKKP